MDNCRFFARTSHNIVSSELDGGRRQRIGCQLVPFALDPEFIVRDKAGIGP